LTSGQRSRSSRRRGIHEAPGGPQRQMYRAAGHRAASHMRMADRVRNARRGDRNRRKA
jgi:hypothetical protein